VDIREETNRLNRGALFLLTFHIYNEALYFHKANGIRINEEDKIRKQEALGRTNGLFSFDMTWSAKNTTSQAILILLRVYYLPRERVYQI
jgi:hypothetical protein